MAPSCRFVPLGPMGLVTKDDHPGREVYSGRATAIAIHPTDTNTVYVGTAGGGVWKTTDAGAHWRALTDRQGTLSIGAIAIDPSNTDRVYVGTGEANITGMRFVSQGLLISDDAGTTWSHKPLLSSDSDVTMVSKIIVSSGGDRVFIGTDAGLFLLQPQAPAATQLTVIDPDPISDLAFDDGGNRLFIAKRLQGMALWSGTGAPVPLGFPDLSTVMGSMVGVRLALAWIASDPDTLFVAVALSSLFQRPKEPQFLHSVQRSNDAGKTWTAVAGPLKAGDSRTGIFAQEQAQYNLLFGRDPRAPSNLFLGLTGLFRSTSLGTDWSVTATDPPVPLQASEVDDDNLHADQHTIAFASTGEIWVGNDGGVWRSDTQGQTWYHRNRGLGSMQFYHGGVDGDLPGLLLGGTQDNGFQQFQGHPTWRSAVGGDVGMVALDTKNQRFWIATNDGAIKINEAGLRAFREVPFPKGNTQGLFLAPFAIAPSDPTIVYTGSEGALYKVDVDTTTWIAIPAYASVANGTVTAITVAPGNPGLVYVAAWGPSGTDRKPSVARVELGLPAVDLQLPDDPITDPPRFVSDLAVSPRDANRLYVAIGEAGGGVRPSRPRIYRCDTGTRIWQDLTDKLPWFAMPDGSSAPSMNPIHAVVIDPDPAVTDAAQEHVYVGCDRGVFRSGDGGDTWELIDDGLPLTPVYDLAFQQSTRRLVAFTHGRGVWMRPADVAPCAGTPSVKEVDLYLRDQRYDIGLGPMPLEMIDPVHTVPGPKPAGAKKGPHPRIPITLRLTDGIDLKVDREAVTSELGAEDDPPAFQTAASTVNYAPDGPLDTIGFEALDHRPPKSKAPARVYLQVHNRGPDEATNVKVRVYYAAQATDGSYPDLPTDFWSQFPDTDPAEDSPWQPIGPASIIASLRPAEPEVVLWNWDVPAQMPPKIGLLAIVTSPDDPVDEGQPLDAVERQIDPLVRNNKRVLLKATNALHAVSGRSWGWLKWAGLAAVVGIGAVLLYEEL